jgi:hypothetical protein
MLEKGNI